MADHRNVRYLENRTTAQGRLESFRYPCIVRRYRSFANFGDRPVAVLGDGLMIPLEADLLTASTPVRFAFEWGCESWTHGAQKQGDAHQRKELGPSEVPLSRIVGVSTFR
jgi:hypothetical protein